MSRAFSLCLLFWSCGLLPVQAQTLHLIHTNGPASTRINLVVLSEGYTSNQLAQFLVDATNLVNRLLEVAPYAEYRTYFNAFAIFVASRESGSDHPQEGIFRDTYFNSTFDSYGIPQLLTIPPNDRDPGYNNGRGKVDLLLEQLMPEYDLPILLVNDLEYGGSGGEVLISSRSSLAAEIVRHESGHTFGGLGDEYSTPYPGYPDIEAPNTTRETRREWIKWRLWIDESTPIPTPPLPSYADAVGLFEGAHYQERGWYRPKLDCKMRSFGAPFCEVCSEALVKSAYDRLRPVEFFSPAQTNLSAHAGATLRFAVQPLRPVFHALEIRWFTNGTEIAGAAAEQLDLPAHRLGEGLHSLRVELRDPTPRVRNDPEGLLQDEVLWMLNIVPRPALRLAIEQFTSGAVHFRIDGPDDDWIVLQRSENLIEWQSVATNRLSSGVFRFSEGVAAARRRYYRAQFAEE
jgi:hypothetical protein